MPWRGSQFVRGRYAAAAKSLQLCLTLCDPIDGSPPGSPVPGILQARALEWVAISFSNAWKRKVKVKSLSRVWLLATPWTAAHQAPPSMGFSKQEYWSGVPLPSPGDMLIYSYYICETICPFGTWKQLEDLVHTTQDGMWWELRLRLWAEAQSLRLLSNILKSSYFIIYESWVQDVVAIFPLFKDSIHSLQLDPKWSLLHPIKCFTLNVCHSLSLSDILKWRNHEIQNWGNVVS